MLKPCGLMSVSSKKHIENTNNKTVSTTTHQNYTTTGTLRMAGLTSAYIDDDFDDIKKHLPQPTKDCEVARLVNSRSDELVVLWRATNGSSLKKILAANSAGGEPANADATVPTVEMIKKQISTGGVVPEFAARDDYTGDASAAIGLSFEHHLFIISVPAKYLSRCSESESGWCCNPATPIIVHATVDRTLGQAEKLAVGRA